MKRLRRSLPLLVLLAVALTSCADDPVPAPAPSPSPTTSSKETRTPEPSKSPEQAFDADRVSLDFEVVAEGFEAPLGVVDAPDGSPRLFVVEQVGRIRSFGSGGRPRDFLDISERISAGGEQGLLGLAFHPDYERNRRFFVNYTDPNGDTVISEFAGGSSADASSERILLTVDQPFANHNGGQLAFGPDGYLYIALGDGGSAGDPEDNGQSLDTFLGKLLRIDVDGERPYAIPRDNPFSEGTQALPEIWAYGLRNPWRFSFDRETGDLWIADVGQSAIEEVNREPADSSGGLNYGWRVFEGDDCFADDCDLQEHAGPFATYPHDFGCSITGGYVYRGDAYPDLRGGYIAGDYCSGNVWLFAADAHRIGEVDPVADTEFSITSFGEGDDGELYLADGASGAILHVVDTEE